MSNNIQRNGDVTIYKQWITWLNNYSSDNSEQC